LNDFLKQGIDGQVCIAHCEEQEKTLLQSVVKSSEKTTILIGPEGDFSSEEIKKCLAKNMTPISLGESRLRTETAALVAVNTISFINQ
jgi:16S rRNA (uracil1498-N3)-methyltransferase